MANVHLDCGSFHLEPNFEIKSLGLKMENLMFELQFIFFSKMGVAFQIKISCIYRGLIHDLLNLSITVYDYRVSENLNRNGPVDVTLSHFVELGGPQNEYFI